MYKISTINTRIEPALKLQAETILHEVGLTSSEAIRLFYKQVCLRHGLPFDVKVPNSVTLKAIHDVEHGKTHKAKNVDTLFDDLD